MKLNDLIIEIEKKYPKFLAESWDNVGLMLGDYDQEIHKVLVSLEANEAVIDEAIALGANLIITHHPFFFSKMNQITSDTVKGRLTLKAVKHEIAIYSMHTNYDIAFDGMNDALIRKLGFEAEEYYLKPTCEEWYLKGHDGKAPGLLRCFTLKEAMNLHTLSTFLKTSLNMEHIRYVGDGNKTIKKVAVITGAAAEYYKDAKSVGADVLITGDLKYHIAQDALDFHMCVIDCGHFETEDIFRESMKEFLSSISSLEILSSNTNLNPFQYA